MGFPLFLLVTCTLFIRPVEVIPGFPEVPIYQWLTVVCLAVSVPQALAQFTQQSLISRPINLCVLLILVAISLSHLSHLQLRLAYNSTTTFSKVGAYYLLLVANVDSFSRLRTLLALLTTLVPIVSGVALLQYHGVINLPALAVVYDSEFDTLTGELLLIARICGTGVFHDPNDLAMIVVFGMVLCVYWFTEPRSIVLKPLLCGCVVLLAYTLAMTKSRGGLMALLAALTVLFHARFGMRKAIPLIAVVLPAMLALFGGRQSDFGTAIESDTGQGRIQFWSEGLAFLRRAPVFGIGYDQFMEEAGHVAHNSFVHCYAELGFFGGTVFFGAFYYAVRGLLRLGKCRSLQNPPEVGRVRPYLAAAVAGFGTSMLSISRSYLEPTYLMLGLTTSYLTLAWPIALSHEKLVSRLLISRLVKASLTFVIATYVFVRVFARWG